MSIYFVKVIWQTLKQMKASFYVNVDISVSCGYFFPFRVESEDAAGRFVRNIDHNLPDYTVT
jgi:hypothetical protein